MRKGHTPNDMRSMAKNPNNPSAKAATDNRSNQLNPQHPAHASSGKGGGGAAAGYGETDEDDEMVELVDDRLEGMSSGELRKVIQRVLKDTPGRSLGRKSPKEMSRSTLEATVRRLQDEDWHRAVAGLRSVFFAGADFDNYMRAFWFPRYFLGKHVKPPQYRD